MIEIKTKGANSYHAHNLTQARNYLRGTCVVSPKADTRLLAGGKWYSGTARELFDQLNEGRIRVPQTTTQGGLF